MKIAPKIIVCDNFEEARTTAENICLIYPWKEVEHHQFGDQYYFVIFDLIDKHIDAELWYN